MHALATREMLFMQLLVALRRSNPVEGESSEARLNQLMAWLEEHFAEDICWEMLASHFHSPCAPCTASLSSEPGRRPSVTLTDCG